MSEFKERHRLTLPALTDLLHLLKILLPPNILPATVYMLRKLLRQVLAHCLGEESSGFNRMHLCANTACAYMYVDEGTTHCPKCGRARHVVQRSGKTKAAQELRYLGLSQGLRILLMSRHVCKGIQDFDTAEMVDSNFSVYSSALSEQLCTQFIPDYDQMADDVRRDYKIRFFRTGQVCTAQQMAEHTLKIDAGQAMRTLLVTVEGGCDAFQPFKRRVWSTWLYGYRVQCINWSTAAKGEFVIVTAISEGAAEGKAAHIVAALDAQELTRLCPLLASQRTPANQGNSAQWCSNATCLYICSTDLHVKRATRLIQHDARCQTFHQSHAYAGIMEAPLRAKMWWIPQGGKATIIEVGLWVVCTGIQADGPMRVTLNRNVGVSGQRGCDNCGLMAVKGAWNATKYLGYSKPCEAELRDHTTGGMYTQCKAWASGVVVQGSYKRPYSRAPEGQISTVNLTAAQKVQRDRMVERKECDMRTRGGAAGTEAGDRLARKVEDMMLEQGSRGLNEFTRAAVPYWDVKLMFPVAVYHCLYLGIAKDMLRWWNVRLGAATSGQKEPLLVPFSRPKDARALIKARCAHFVLRNKPDCIMVDFTAHVGSMSMSEVQLLFEVGVPYYCHDLRQFGVPAAATAMLLLLRHGMMCFTRIVAGESFEEYKARLLEGRAALTAYSAIAEYLHDNKDTGCSQFSFTWKLHVAIMHLLEQILGLGHPIQASDAWVEQMMRHKACTVVK